MERSREAIEMSQVIKELCMIEENIEMLLQKRVKLVVKMTFLQLPDILGQVRP